MVQPINYMAELPQIDLGASLAGLGQEFQRIRQDRQASRASQQYRADLEATFKSGRPEDFSALIAKYPQQREAFRDSWDILSKEQQDAEFRGVAEVFSALQFKPEIAAQLLDDRIEATENSGEDATDLKNIRQALDRNPEMVKSQLAFTLSSVDPEKWQKVASEMRNRDLAPSQLSASQSKAREAAVNADFAESKAVADLQKKGWDVFKLQEDAKIAKENTRIAALNANLKRAKNELQREQLQVKLDEMKRKRDDAINEKVAGAEQARLGIDNSLNTIDRVLKNPELPNVIGSLEGARFYPSTLMGILNPFADADRRADATADIETIQGQQFLDNLMAAKERGAAFGSLTEKEGAKLEGYIASLKTRQSEGQFIDNLKEIQRLLLKSRGVLAQKTGIPESIPDTPNVETTPEQLEELLRLYGGD